MSDESGAVQLLRDVKNHSEDFHPAHADDELRHVNDIVSEYLSRIDSAPAAEPDAAQLLSQLRDLHDEGVTPEKLFALIRSHIVDANWNPSLELLETMREWLAAQSGDADE